MDIHGAVNCHCIIQMLYTPDCTLFQIFKFFDSTSSFFDGNHMLVFIYTFFRTLSLPSLYILLCLGIRPFLSFFLFFRWHPLKYSQIPEVAFHGVARRVKGRSIAQEVHIDRNIKSAGKFYILTRERIAPGATPG